MDDFLFWMKSKNLIQEDKDFDDYLNHIEKWTMDNSDEETL